MPPVTRNRFAPSLPPEQERKRRLYLLDSHPVHTLQVFGVPQYLPKEIHGFNSVSTEDFVRHHERVRSMIADGHLTFGFDEQGVESSLALVFGFNVLVTPKTSAQQPVHKQVRVLQLYYEAPEPEDVPPGVFGAAGVAESAWRPSASKDGSRVFQHVPSAGARASPAGSERPDENQSRDSRET
jgi:hypothetical protein